MRLAHILIRPRETMRAILAQPHDRAAMPLILAVAFISAISDMHYPSMRRAVADHPAVTVALLMLVGTLVTSLVSLILLYVFGWVTTLIGRFFDGTGAPRAMRSAIAWGLVPVLWSFPYRIVTFFFAPVAAGPTGERIVINPGRFASGCGWAVVAVTVELLVFAACVWVGSNTIGEAHNFSSLRGFATFILSVVSPIVVAVAAILSFAL